MKILLLAFALAGAVWAQPPADEGIPAPAGAKKAAPPRSPVTPKPEDVTKLRAKLGELNAAIQSLQAAKFDDDLIVDVEATAWVIHNTLRVPDGFVTDGTLPGLLSAGDDALRRAGQIKTGTAAWPKLKGSVKRAYRSAVDGTAQPYTVSIPLSYDPAKPTPLYLYLHGRSTPGGNPANPDLAWGQIGGGDRENPERAGGGGRAVNYIRVNAFGRGNNSFRWAGETDVFEVIASVSKRYHIDPDRILLAGFSMGGAGSWQIGLHNSDLFCGLEIDAGVIGNRLDLDGLTPVQKATNATYGILIDHALNVFNIPLVGYAGENDAQLAASTSIREQLGRENFTVEKTGQFRYTGKDVRALFLANPGQGHSHATGDTLRQIDEFSAANLARGRVVPDHIRYITYTTRYNRSHWVTVDGLLRHFERASVEAERDAAKSVFTIKTNNVSRLLLTDTAAARTISIDGDTLRVQPAAELLLVRSGHWRTANPAATTGLRKQHNLQGPVNDAFFDSFLCVNPTGRANNALAAARAKQEWERFAKLFTRDFLGEARAKDDTAVTAADIAANTLVLFGDPGSNQLIAQIATKLPIAWTKESIVVGGKTYSAADHVPVLIYPNPLNPKRYVVINTGLVASRGATAYGDYAVLKVSKRADGQIAAETADEGVFDESWQLPAPKT